MTQDLYKRIQRLIENYQGTSMIKRAREDDVKDEMMEHAVVPEQAVEPGEFSKEMDRILAEYLPSSVAAKDELDEDEAISSQRDIQEQSPATTDVSMADEEEDEGAELESPIAVGEDAEEQLEELKSARKIARKLSDSTLINEFRNATKEIIGFLSALEKSAAFTGVLPMVPPTTPQDLVSGIMKQAQTDADLVAAQMADAEEVVEEVGDGIEEAADQAVNVVDEATNELAEDLIEVLDDVAEEIEEVITQVEEELREQGQPEAAEMVRPIAVQAVSSAFGVPVEEAGVPLATSGSRSTRKTRTEEEEEEEEEEVAGEVADLSDEETVNELGNAMEDLGLTPEELVEEAKDKEARKSAALIAQAVKHLKMARRFKRTAAVYEKHRKIRNAMKNYLLELIN